MVRPEQGRWTAAPCTSRQTPESSEYAPFSLAVGGANQQPGANPQDNHALSTAPAVPKARYAFLSALISTASRVGGPQHALDTGDFLTYPAESTGFNSSNQERLHESCRDWECFCLSWTSCRRPQTKGTTKTCERRHTHVSKWTNTASMHR